METKRKNKNRLITMAIVVLVLFIAVGYAILQTNLRINGSTKISKSSWDIHFENIVNSDRGVSAESPATIDSSRTGVNFTVNLPKLGDFYEFYVDIVNSGNFDAKLESINTTNLTDEQKKYLDLEVTYSDGSLLNIGDKIPSLKSDTIRVLVQFKPDPLILPETSEPVNFNVHLTFVQDDGTGSLREESNLLYNVLKDNAVMDNISSTYVSSPTGINLGAISSDTNGKGVYTLSNTANNANPIYYYRGAVTNNNVLFGGYCWKMIRTTNTGGIKMIYNGQPTNGVCNATGEDTVIASSKYNNQSNPGYTYDNGSGNQVDSAVKVKVDDWFTNASGLTEYLSYLEDTPFYNERDNVQGEGNIKTAYGPRLRIWGSGSNTEEVLKTNIILGAFNNEDRYTTSISNGNGYLTNPIGLITTDEIVLAGGRGYISSSDTGSNNSYYLYSNTNYWTMSPLYMSQTNSNNIAIINNNGSINELAWDSTSGIRPVISIRAGITYTDGDGTSSSPYQVNKAENFNSKSLYKMMVYNSVKDDVASEYVTGNNRYGNPGIHFGQISSDSNGKGIYELTQSKENGETIYYYRGDVKNNNVLFGGFCWKIIRTSSTKGVKLIYNGTKQADGCTATGTAASIGTSAYNTYYNTINSMGYTNGSENNSAIKTKIDTWYSKKLDSYTQYLEDIPFYNGLNYQESTDGSKKFFWPRIRLCGLSTICNPTISRIEFGTSSSRDTYTVSSSIGNGYLQYPVGLITVEEAVMAGGRSSAGTTDSAARNNTYYLYTSNMYYTMSPYQFYGGSAYMYTVNSNGSVDGYSSLNSECYVRPVVSLKPGTVYTTGDGTVSNPYVIATP